MYVCVQVIRANIYWESTGKFQPNTIWGKFCVINFEPYITTIKRFSNIFLIRSFYIWLNLMTFRYLHGQISL